jgi:predicted nicotinamide N-methyase
MRSVRRGFALSQRGFQKLRAVSEECSEAYVPATSIRLAWLSVPVGSKKMPLAVPLSEDDVLDFHISNEEAHADPYWGILWPSSIALSEFLINHPHIVNGKSVTEIGSGLSLCGLVAASHCNALPVTLLDKQPHCLWCAKRSALALGINESTVKTHVADWVSANEHDLVEHELSSKSDVALACDVLYEENMARALGAHILRFAREELVIADPLHRKPRHRQIMLDHLPQHAKLASEIDFHCSAPPAPPSQPNTPPSSRETNVQSSCAIRIMRIALT